MPATITAADIANTINAAPAWCKIALTLRSERLREEAVGELARHLHAALYEASATESGQLAVPLAACETT